MSQFQSNCNETLEDQIQELRSFEAYNASRNMSSQMEVIVCKQSSALAGQMTQLASVSFMCKDHLRSGRLFSVLVCALTARSNSFLRGAFGAAALPPFLTASKTSLAKNLWSQTFLDSLAA